MGFVPTAYQPDQESNLPGLEECKQQLQKAWELARQAMKYTQLLWCKTSNHHPYRKGRKV